MPMIDGQLWRSEEDWDYFWWCVMVYGTGLKEDSLAGWVALRPECVRLPPKEKDGNG